MTEKLTSIRGKAVPLLWDNVDTDALVPAAPHKRISGGGRDRLSEILFYEFRFNADGSPKPDFALNKPQFQEAPILIVGENFGCGSSREAAVWALQDYGFCAVVARNFADIFEQNAYKNQLLPAAVDASTHARIIEELGRSPASTMSIELVERRIRIADDDIGSFSADEMGLEMIINGVDEFSLTAHHVPEIKATQRRLTETYPWLEL
jgi:3-isopropylmalate dehydratase small subunit